MNNHPLSIDFKCICGRIVALKLIGGQYQYTWQGDCLCGRKWELEDVSENLEAEDNIEKPFESHSSSENGMDSI
jgi:hypothetical protein